MKRLQLQECIGATAFARRHRQQKKQILHDRAYYDLALLRS